MEMIQGKNMISSCNWWDDRYWSIDTICNNKCWYNLYEKQAGQEYIPVHIYPTKLTVNNFNKLKSDYFKNNIKLLEFWTNLKEHWDYFEKNKTLPYYEVNRINGKYIIINKW
jgi:murein L,D-transpeptidase YafK